MYRDPALFTLLMLQHYSFDLDVCSAEKTVDAWLEAYSAKWIAGAIVEAIYQGRYKVMSVHRILLDWQQRGQPLYHFDYEFADFVCREAIEQATIRHQDWHEAMSILTETPAAPVAEKVVRQAVPPRNNVLEVKKSNFHRNQSISRSVKLVTKLQVHYKVA